MRKSITKIICVATAAISAFGVAFAAGCGVYRAQGVKDKDPATNVTSNGGFVVETDGYAYFINGVELNTADNNFGSVVKGSIRRISKDNLKVHNYSSTETVVPAIAYSANYNAGIYIYGDYIYFSTPSTSKNSDGEIQNSKLEFKRAKLDGTETMGGCFYMSPSTSLDYRYVEVGDTVYLMYALSESLYGEENAVTNIHSFNTSDNKDTLIAYNVSEYVFDTEDPTNPHVFYTMAVSDNIGSENAFTESYNQLYVARADATQSLKEYDFSYLPEDHDLEEDPLYINKGQYVYDGIGVVGYGNHRTQFNYESTENYSIDYTGYTYKPVSYKNGVLQFTAQQNGEAKSLLCRVAVNDVVENGVRKTSWDPISANKALKTENLILNVSDTTEYIFVTIDGKEKVMYAGSNGIEIGEILGGEVKNSYPVTSGGKPTFLAVREETTAKEEGEGTEKHLYAYYSLTGGNGYTVYRIAIDGALESYATNKLPYEDVYTYSEVRILDVDCTSGWYKPEFVGNQLLFATETTGMTNYNYIMACDLGSADGDMMSNAELNAYKEKFDAVFEKIGDYDEVKNSDGTTAYENLSSALKYLFYTGDRAYLAELIQAYVDVEDRDEEYKYSKESAQIYLDYADVKGDWAEYAADKKSVNGKDVYANDVNYYYSIVGQVTEDDAEAIVESYRSSYMQTYPTDDSTWWDGLNTAARVCFIVGMCVAGLLVLGGIAVLIVWLVRKKKSENNGEEERKLDVDITDDRDIDVYSDENSHVQQLPDGE